MRVPSLRSGDGRELSGQGLCQRWGCSSVVFVFVVCFGIKCFQYMICEALSWSPFSLFMFLWLVGRKLWAPSRRGPRGRVCLPLATDYPLIFWSQSSQTLSAQQYVMLCLFNFILLLLWKRCMCFGALFAPCAAAGLAVELGSFTGSLRFGVAAVRAGWQRRRVFEARCQRS